MKERGRRDGGKGSEDGDTKCVRENRCHSRGGEDSNTRTHSPQIIAGIITSSSAQIRKKVKTHKIIICTTKKQKRFKTVYKETQCVDIMKRKQTMQYYTVHKSSVNQND